MDVIKKQVDSKGYTIGNSRYPRVTSIVGCLPKPALVPWAAKVVAEYAVENVNDWSRLSESEAVYLLKNIPNKQRDTAAVRGTTIHKAVEAYVEGGDIPELADDEERSFAAVKRFLFAAKVKVLATEVTVYSNLPEKYAGTCDLWARMKGDLWLLDWKTSKGVYPDYALQLTAYAIAERAILYGEDVAWSPGFGKFPRIGIVHVTQEKCVLHEIITDPGQLTATWRSLYAIHNWTKLNRESVLRVCNDEN